MPIWRELPNDGGHVYRLQTDDGERVIGRQVSPGWVAAACTSGPALAPHDAFAALMAGRGSDDPHRAYPGDRPSTTILLDRVDPRALGALIAFYEQRVFANAVLLDINPFDQFGVELGKEMAKALDTQSALDFDPSTEALIASAFGDQSE